MTIPVPEIGSKLCVWDQYREQQAVIIEIEQVEAHRYGQKAKLAAPYDERMGWFSLDDLTKNGKVSSQGIDAYLPDRWERDKDHVLRKPKLNSHCPFEFLEPYSDPFGLSHQEQRRLLGLSDDIPLTAQLIEKAFKLKAKETHPDLGGENEAFLAAKEARDVLMASIEPSKRK